MSHHIRIATVDDATKACAVLRQSITECCIQDHRNDPALLDAWLRNKTAENVAVWIDNPQFDSVVATAQSEIIGFALSQHDEISLCYVRPDVRFTGVGKAMLHTLEVLARQRGVAVLRLDSTLTANSFYQRNEFTPIGPTRSIFGMPALPMSKALPQTS